MGAFGLVYVSGASRTGYLNRSACLRKSIKYGSCPSGVTAYSGAHCTKILPAKLSTVSLFGSGSRSSANRSPSE